MTIRVMETDTVAINEEEGAIDEIILDKYWPISNFP